MTSATGGDPVRSIGARLRAARERKGLKLLEAAEKLHVDAGVLEALEAQDFAALGAEVFVRGHLRRYAELLGESPAELQQLYTRGTLAERPDLTRIPHREPGEGGARLLTPALLGLGGVTLIGLFWWTLNTPAERPQPLGAQALVTSAAGEEAAPAAPRAPAAAASPVGEAQLMVHFAAFSWVEVSDAKGQPLLEGLFARGVERSVSGTPPLRVMVGNAQGVDLWINGQPVALAGFARRDGTARLLIDAEGQASVAPARLAHGE